METQFIWKNKAGDILHFGKDWPSHVVPVYVKDTNDSYIIDPETNTPIISETQETNPLPKEAYLVEEQGEFIDGYWVNELNIYKIKRAKEYPNLEDQLDMIYHNKENWVACIEKIKKKYPKKITKK